MKWLLKDLLCPPVLTLKQGAAVILLKNLDQGNSLVNGSRGTGVGFGPDLNDSYTHHLSILVEGGLETRDKLDALPQFPIVEFDIGKRGAPVPHRRTVTPEDWKIEQAGEMVAMRRQIPLKLAWAISIHKSQGMTLNAAEVDLA